MVVGESMLACGRQKLGQELNKGILNDNWLRIRFGPRVHWLRKLNFLGEK